MTSKVTLNMKRKKFTLVLIVLVTLIFSCGAPLNRERTAQGSEYTPICEIWKDVQKYQNEIITVSGKYRGWHGEGLKNPLITRGDWVIRDSTGAIYVTGRFPAGLGKKVSLGTEIIVKGQLLLSKDKVPYIKAKEIIPK